jgi:hypothetical protein
MPGWQTLRRLWTALAAPHAASSRIPSTSPSIYFSGLSPRGVHSHRHDELVRPVPRPRGEGPPGLIRALAARPSAGVGHREGADG